MARGFAKPRGFKKPKHLAGRGNAFGKLKPKHIGQGQVKPVQGDFAQKLKGRANAITRGRGKHKGLIKQGYTRPTGAPTPPGAGTAPVQTNQPTVPSVGAPPRLNKKGMPRAVPGTKRFKRNKARKLGRIRNRGISGYGYGR
jgi:hypothetical protein